MRTEITSSHWFEQQFINMLGSRVGEPDDEVKKIVAELAAAAIAQHSCLDLNRHPKPLIEKLKVQTFIGDPGDKTPIVLSNNRLYLNRFYRFEKEVAAMIAARNVALTVKDKSMMGERLGQYFDEDKQKLAALLAISRQLAIITGGPGTGKTSTVVKILSILLESDDTLDIKLAAPTGKAAMRLGESIRQSTGRLEFSHPLLVDPKVVTLHRLLGMRRDGRTFRHGPHNPITADLLVVDEASMIDLTMMHRLLESLPAETRLVLLGDPDQLPSVDTGNVLADLCAVDPMYSVEFAEFAKPFVGTIPASTTHHKLSNAICRLEKSYRFDENSAIGQLAAGIRKGSASFHSSQDGRVTIESLDERPEALSGEKLLGVWVEYLE